MIRVSGEVGGITRTQGEKEGDVYLSGNILHAGHLVTVGSPRHDGLLGNIHGLWVGGQLGPVREVCDSSAECPWAYGRPCKLYIAHEGQGMWCLQ